MSKISISCSIMVLLLLLLSCSQRSLPEEEVPINEEQISVQAVDPFSYLINAEKLAYLKELVQNEGLNSNIERSLLAKLNTALNQSDNLAQRLDNNPNYCNSRRERIICAKLGRSIKNKLEQFIEQVEHLSKTTTTRRRNTIPAVIGEEAATELIDLAECIIDSSKPIPTDLFISEYGEGSSFNKYLEIYNPTFTIIDLSDYQVWRVSNGGSWAEAIISLTGSLGIRKTLIVYNPQADSTIASARDIQISSGTLSHNGNDALALTKFGTIIDVIGTDGADPGDGWDVAGVTNATKDHVLMRKAAFCEGNNDWIASSGTNASDSEWIVLSNEDWSDIGMHSCN